MRNGSLSGRTDIVDPSHLLMRCHWSTAVNALLGATSFGVTAAVALVPLTARANMMDQIILSKCSAAMQEDFQKVGKTPPDGMVADTCNCVVAQMKKRQTIDQAKTFCSKQSLQKYGQP